MSYLGRSLEGVYLEEAEISYLIDEDDDMLNQVGSTKSPLFAKRVLLRSLNQNQNHQAQQEDETPLAP